ncbi:MAG: hypothetical protein L0Z53_19940 [Acidobacteriales bacterium]|nr:hypothetical protein [Terriglobales bacterium]
MLAITATCAAQSICRGANSSTVEQRDGVTVKSVSFPAPYQNVTAHVFLPDRDGPVPGIVFPYSEIAGPTAKINMLVWARALARAGAASIVLDGTLDPMKLRVETDRPGRHMACASQWLLANAKLDMERLADVRPSTWGGGNSAFCRDPREEDPCFHPSVTLDARPPYEIFQRKIDPEGPMRQAKFLQRHFRIAEVQPAWLDGMIVPAD